MFFFFCLRNKILSEEAVKKKKKINSNTLDLSQFIKWVHITPSMGLCTIWVGVLLGATSIIAGAPNTNHEKTEIPLMDQVNP